MKIDSIEMENRIECEFEGILCQFPFCKKKV